MKYFIACIFLSFNLHVFSQVLNNPESFAESISPANLKKHLFAIASVEMEGRETATEGQKKAASYIEEQFKQKKLLPGWNGTYQQRFSVYRDSLMKAVLSVEGKDLRYDSDFVVSNNSGYNVSLMASEVLFAGFGFSDSSRDDYKNVNAKGKIVMVLPGAPMVMSKGRKVKGPAPDYYTLQFAAQKNGAIALLIVESRFPRMPSSRKGGMYVNDYRSENLPNTFFISDSVARMIMGKDFDIAKKIMKTSPPPPKSCYVRVNLELEKSTEHLESSNVIGILEGTDKKEESIIITAHYDHLGTRDSLIYFGADDDGSGTVSVLELAEAFSRAADSGIRPRRNIIFMTVSGEEKGLWGSSYYAENPAFPLDKTSADINIDMIGRVEKGRKQDSLNYLYVVGDNRMSSDLRTISEESNKKSMNFILDYKFNDPNDPERIFYRSDHYNFARKGVPAIFYFSGLHDDYHRPTDTPDKINYELLARRGKLIFYTAWEMANRDDLLKRDLE